MKQEFKSVKNTKTGRPLSFDRDEVLKKAMLAFWKHGFETTSISELTREMGLTAPSIYLAFGDKRGLFFEALELYTGDLAQIDSTISVATSSFAAAKQMLEHSAKSFTQKGFPSGCLLASSTASGSAEIVDVQKVVSDRRAAIEKSLRKRIDRDLAEGKIGSNVSAADLAAFVIAIIQGMSVLARDGASRAKLNGVANVAMMAWPS